MKTGIRGPGRGVRGRRNDGRTHRVVRRTIRFALVAAVLLAAGATRAQQRVELTVLFTSDLHAHVLPVDDLRDKPAAGSLAQVASLVARVRAESPNTVLLDGGDAIQGTPLGYYAIAAAGAPGEDPTIAAMNLVGYDAAVVGNHEFNFGLDVLRRSLGQSRFPWLAANLDGADAAKLPVRDEVVVERGGVRIGVLGLTNPNVPHWEPPEHWRGLSFRDPVATAAARLPALHARADVVLVVVHSGFERDLDSGEDNGSGVENFAWRLAQLPGIDLLLTGHTHRSIPPRALGKTVVAQPGRWAEMVTRVDLDLERDGGHWRMAGWRGDNLPVGGEPADVRVTAAVAAAHEHAVAELSRPIGALAAPLTVTSFPIADDPGVDLIHAVQLEASGAQLSLAAPLGMAKVVFPAGPITPRLVQALYPYANTLVVVRLTGAQLADVLEHAVRGIAGVDCRPPAGCALLRDPRVPPYNFDTLEGATYEVDPAAPAGHRIRALRIGGAPVGAEASFTVAINSYRASGGGGYPHLARAPRVKEIDRPIADLIVEYFLRHGTVAPAATGNWAFTVPVHAVMQEPPPAPAAPR